MQDDLKTFEQWEEQPGWVVINATPEQSSQRMTRDEFEKLAHVSGTPHGVNHADRKRFLIENGYEITRENMVDPNLSHAQKGQSQ